MYLLDATAHAHTLKLLRAQMFERVSDIRVDKH